jgi:5-methylcytosine-specific restriction endonuclease McrA
VSAKKQEPDPERTREILAEARRYREQQESSYRGQALKLFPPICAHCGREFSGKRLSELTVHHKDNDRSNNPPDGSNWELLCLYCHDYEHSQYVGYNAPDPLQPGRERKEHMTYRPFADLKSLLEDKMEDET